ncbi:MAG: alpha-mannosidase [Clostridiales bacterium]|nr:alpha-mannosidase [Clostridiales bacterium]
MLTDQAVNQTIRKMKRFANMLTDRMFVSCASLVPTGYCEVSSLAENFREPPRASEYGRQLPERWGGNGHYAWFHMDWEVPAELDGESLYFFPHLGFYEATLWVNGKIQSNYAAKYVEGSHGNHWCNRFVEHAKAGTLYSFDLECYAWHEVPGTAPFETVNREDFTYPVRNCDVCTRDDAVFELAFDLRTLLSLRDCLAENSLRRAEVENALLDAHRVLLYDPAASSPETFHAALRKASPFLKEALSRKNGDTPGYVGLTGHSHMDTAWLWTISETEKKCARTYANSLNLMEEYPEYRFVQSSAYHTDMLRRDYPELFERIREAVARGQWEPNGGVWVECDCNLTGGEYMVRQFLWGQRFTRKYFNYTSDCFWLPDTFGYSAAIPQIMKGCGVQYFLTTKLSWNDTTVFPATTFVWQGLDGTRVLTHFNRTHQGPEPELIQRITEGSEAIRDRRVTDMRLFSFGKGDGGGGPEFEMLEYARRVRNLNGIARCEYTSVSDFMKRLEKNVVDPTLWADELYLELHRGTLTNQHEIKRGNRLLEIALHNLEAAEVMRAVKEDRKASEEKIAPMMNTLLVNQFHDILPGTCIHAANVQSWREVGEAIRLTRAETAETLSGQSKVLFNGLAMERRETLHLPGELQDICGAENQRYSDVEGKERLSVYGVELKPLSTKAIAQGETEEKPCPFAFDGDTLSTPYAEIRFDEQGAIASLVDRRNGRELVGQLPFNSFLMAEDVPADYDNWDVDADTECRFERAGRLVERKLISCGSVELVIRSVWELGEQSKLTQDMIFDAHDPLISFESSLDWQEEHHFLKAAFDTTLHADGVRNEIQFGCIRRGNHRGTDRDKARFEVCNHKYSDISERNYGLSVLNDCKYGISEKEGCLALSLHRGGMRPDPMGDKGLHTFRYAIYLHDEPYGENVVEKAYQFNYPVQLVAEGLPMDSLVSVNNRDVVLETVKPCEDAQKAYIIRLYESTGAYAKCRLTFGHPVQSVHVCNMLEEEERTMAPDEELVFTPFTIQTIKVVYGED